MKQYVKLLKGKRLASAHGLRRSTGPRSGALVVGRASVDSARRTKAIGKCLPSGRVIASGVMRRGGVEVRGSSQDAGVMVPSDPS